MTLLRVSVRCYNMRRMNVELEPEVTSWYLGLDHNDMDAAAVHVELLSEYGHLSGCRIAAHWETVSSNFDSTWAARHAGSPTGTGPTE
jgi:hypothetical protein